VNFLQWAHTILADFGEQVGLTLSVYRQSDRSRPFRVDNDGNVTGVTYNTHPVANFLRVQAIHTVAGTLVVAAGTLRIYNQTGRTLTISEVFLAVGTAPVGSAIIVDVHKDGTTLFTTQANRPQIADGTNSGNSTTIDVTSWADGAYLTADVDQIGSGTAGSDLTVHVIAA